ncbi:MAG: hypothetical protein ACRD4U_02495 [Candidatus Acidiferrales bacterium]
MRHRPVWLILLALAAVAALPALAQQPSSGFRLRVNTAPRSFSQTNTGNPNFNFIPGFGLQPAVPFAPGFGFDATHHTLIHGRRFHHGFPGTFFGGGFHNPNFTVGFGGFFPFFPVASSSSSVVIVQQPAQPQVIVIENSDSGGVPVAAGLPDDWPRLRVAASSYAPQQQPLPAIILLVRKNEIIVPAVDYWLEDDIIFYVTSTGRQGSFPLRDLDWNMTTRLNAERGYEFVLRTAN